MNNILTYNGPVIYRAVNSINNKCYVGKSYKEFIWSYNKPCFVAIQNMNSSNCWKLLPSNVEDNQQRSLFIQERSTTIAEMRVGTSVPKRGASFLIVSLIKKDDDIVCSVKKFIAGYSPATNVTYLWEQKVWELAGEALRNFITVVDSLRDDLIVVTEYHADYSIEQGSYQMYTPAGKMLTEKFKPETYYDVLLQTEALVEDTDGEPIRKYNFITEKTSKYPLARCMGIFEETKVPTNLRIVLEKVREVLGMPKMEEFHNYRKPIKS